jgi:cold shock CspA family protein
MDDNNEKPRQRGRVIRFLADKGFGFIKPSDAGGKHCFFHISDVTGDVEPASGEVVTYALGEDRHGRAKAIEINLFSDHDDERN